MLITVTCSSLQILEGLWEGYSSRHLNEVVQQTLVTPDVLEKLGLSELKLTTTISEEEYNKCKEYFSSEQQVRGADCLMQNYAKKFRKSSHLIFGGQVFNTLQTSTTTRNFDAKWPNIGSVFLNCTDYDIYVLLKDRPLPIQHYINY